MAVRARSRQRWQILFSLDVNHHQRIILRFMVSGFAAFGLALAFYRYLMAVSPTVADASSGRVCPMDEHGYVFFVTADQRIGKDVQDIWDTVNMSASVKVARGISLLRSITLLAVFCVLALIATALSIRWKEFQSPKSYIELFKHLTKRSS